jgi:hypothetical protein
LNTRTDQLAIYLGQSAETSDFIGDCLADWWQHNQADYPDLDEWVTFWQPSQILPKWDITIVPT